MCTELCSELIDEGVDALHFYTLNRAELAQLLKALNENMMPADQDIDWVMDRADVIGNGVITRPELSKAISLW